MRVICRGLAIIADKTTGEEFTITADQLDWYEMGVFLKSMGPETHHTAEVGHDKLGLLMWDIWEYPEGIQNRKETDVGEHQLVQDFDYYLEFENHDLDPLKALRSSATPLDELPKTDRIVHMIAWFFRHYEPWDEKSSILGNETSENQLEQVFSVPQSALGILDVKFGADLSEFDIAVAATMIEERDNVFDWMPRANHPNAIETKPPSEADGEQDPTLQDVAEHIKTSVKVDYSREGVWAAQFDLLTLLEELPPLVERTQNTPSHGAMGHNNPPPETVFPINLTVQITNHLERLKSEFEKEEPEIEGVLEATTALEKLKAELKDFGSKTLEQLKSQGSKALASAIIGGVALLLGLATRWLALASGFQLPF